MVQIQLEMVDALSSLPALLSLIGTKGGVCPSLIQDAQLGICDSNEELSQDS